MGHCVNTSRKGKGVVFCVEIEPATLQGLKREQSNKIGSVPETVTKCHEV